MNFYLVKCKQFPDIYPSKFLCFPKISTFYFIFDKSLGFSFGGKVQIISHSVRFITAPTILAFLFSSLMGNNFYSETNIAKLNSGSSILSIVKASNLLTGKTSRGKKKF